MFGIPPEILMSLITGVASFFAKQAAYKRQDQKELIELALKKGEAENSWANQAAERSSPILRKIVALIIISICFGGLLIVSFFPQIPVSFLLGGEEHSILFGLFSWTSKIKVAYADGFFLSDFVKFGVTQVVAFLFGGSLAKASR